MWADGAAAGWDDADQDEEEYSGSAGSSMAEDDQSGDSQNDESEDSSGLEDTAGSASADEDGTPHQDGSGRKRKRAAADKDQFFSEDEMYKFLDEQDKTTDVPSLGIDVFQDLCKSA